MSSSLTRVGGTVCALLLGVTVPALAQNTQDHAYTAADVAAGSQLYARQCQLCHGQNGDGITGIDLRRGQFRRVTSDSDIAGVLAKGSAAGGMPSFNFQPAEVNGIIAFIRAGFDPGATPIRVGDPVRGQAVFEEKGRCLTCHRVNGRGIRTAPDLSDIGAQRTPAALQRSLVDPTSAMLPINRPVRAVTREGRTIRGRRLNEDTYTVQIIDDEERLVSLTKVDLREYEVGKTSSMPPASKTLSAAEVSDVLAYLLSLKGL